MKILILGIIYKFLKKFCNYFEFIENNVKVENDCDNSKNEYDYYIDECIKIDIIECINIIISKYYKDVDVSNYIYKDITIDNGHINHDIVIEGVSCIIDTIEERKLTRFLLLIHKYLTNYFGSHRMDTHIHFGIYICEKCKIIYYKAYDITTRKRPFE